MTYKVYLDSVYDGDKAGVLYEGQYKPAAVAVLRACEQLSQRVEMIEIQDDKFGLTQTQIYSLCEELADWFYDGVNDSIGDIVRDGYQGIHDYSLEELIGFAEEYIDYSDTDDCTLFPIVQTYRANQAVEKLVLV